MRAAVEEVLDPGEVIVGVWTTRGFGANALVCAATRALIAKRAELIRWSVATFQYADIDSVDVHSGRPGAAAQIELVPRLDGPPREPGKWDEFPDAYFQESRRLVAPNTLMFRGRGRAREAAETVEQLIAAHTG
jgi:hypothetical protein